jgi:hypothetical protein
MTIDREEIDVSAGCIRNCIEEMALLALRIKQYFQDDEAIMEPITPDFAKVDLEEVPFQYLSSCRKQDPIDLEKDQIVPSGFRSSPDEIGNISLPREKSVQIPLKDEFWSTYFENTALQLFELEKSIIEHREPRFILDLEEMYYPHPSKTQRVKFFGISLKNSLRLSESNYEKNMLWESYKQLLHEFNQLIAMIQKLQRKRLCTPIRLKKNHNRSAYVNGKPKGFDNILNQLFSFYMKNNRK